MLYYHGTSSNRIRRILKEGLIPYPKERHFSGSEYKSRGGMRSLESFGGVYLTQDILTAFTYATNTREGKPALVAVQYDDRTPDAVLDEDRVIDSLALPLGIKFGDIAKNLRNPYGGVSKISYEHLIGNIKRGCVGRVENNFAANLLSELENTEFGERADTFVSSCGDLVKSREKAFEAAKKALKFYAIHLLDQEVEGNIEIIKDSLTPLKESVTLLSKYIRNDTGVGEGPFYDKRIRVLSPITYRGRNKIISIAVLNVFEDTGRFKIEEVYKSCTPFRRLGEWYVLE